jgi:hypothetical protein
LNKLSYKIEPSEFSNDHQVRLFVDESDILGDEQLGLDPIDFSRFVKSDNSGNVLLGRCDCGCIGCDDVVAQVTIGDQTVTWVLLGKTFYFDRDAYESAVGGIALDHSWEDTGRRVERILTEQIHADARWVNDHTRFDWVSTRISGSQLTYSFTIDGQQITFSTGWDGKTEDSAIDANRRVLYERFS